MLPPVDVWLEALRLAGATCLLTAFLLELRAPRHSRLGPGLVGLLMLLAGGFGVLLATVAPLAARTEQPLLPLAFDYLEQSQHGPTLLLPVVPAVYGLMLWYGARSAASPGIQRTLYVLTALALLATAGLFAYGGHGSDDDRLAQLGMLFMVIHVAAGITWAALVLSLLPRLPLADALELHRRLARFGNHALLLVVLLVPSGLAAAWLHGTPVPWPLDDPYGVLLTVKLLLLNGALAAAGWNRWVELPRSAADPTRLRRVLAIEAGLLTLLLFAAAWLARTLPLTSN